MRCAVLFIQVGRRRQSRGWKFPCLFQIPPYASRVKSEISKGISNLYERMARVQARVSSC